MEAHHIYSSDAPLTDPPPTISHIVRNGTTCSTSYMYKGRRGISKDPYRRNTEGRSTHLQTPQCSSLVV